MRKRGRGRIEGPFLEWRGARSRGGSRDALARPTGFLACCRVEVSWRHVCLVARIRELLASLVAKRPFMNL